MFLLAAAPSAWVWVTNISTGLLLAWGLAPEENPYEDTGFVCIALVSVYLIFQAAKQSRRLYVAIKTMKEV